MKIGDKLLAGQLNLGDKYAVTTHKDTVVASCVAADEEIELPPVADGAAPAEPEVVGAKKDEAASAEPAKK